MGLLDKSVFNLKKNESMAVNPEIAQFEQKLAVLEQQKQEVIFNVGLLYVEKNDASSAAGTEFEPLLKQLEQIAKESNVLHKRILSVQGLRKCESCGNVLPLDSMFCNKCGEKLQPLFEAEDVVGNMCSKCGSVLDDGAVFCASCGAKVEE